MKLFNFALFLISTLLTFKSWSHPNLLNAEQEDEYFENNTIESISLPHTFGGQKAFSKGIALWNECDFYELSGNYFNSNCNNGRRISAELNTLLEKNFIGCVSKASQRKYRPQAVHIIHKGIFADKRHSPLSMHAFGRAIDIKEIIVTTKANQRVSYNFERVGDGTFYKKFRRCWGKVIKRQAKCPYFEKDRNLTGSIGKEDEDHQRHMHLSVPACQSGKYIEPYFKR
jgi:hypothetical protein